VPAAGLRWLIVSHPRRIFADPELGRAIFELAPPDRLASFASATGVDPRQVQDVVAAGYDLGTLYVTALPAADGGHARSLFEQRLSAGAIVKHPRPELYRIAGTRDGTPRALVSVGDRLLAFAVGDLTLSRVAEAYAEGRLKSPTALRGASLSTLPSVGDALAVLYAPGPFSGAWTKAASGLLADALAVAVVVKRDESAGASLRFEIIVAGDWTPDAAQSRMVTAWTDFASSSPGRLFGLDQAKNVNSVAHLHELTWSGELSLPQLVAGLRAATVANVPEILDVHGGDQTGSPDEQQPAP
jgi:hypothetical protein